MSGDVDAAGGQAGSLARVSELAGLFPDEDFRLQLTLRRGEPRAFFTAQDASGRVRAERRRWIADTPGRYAVVRSEGEPMVREFAGWCREWGVSEANAVETLGGEVEPDFLVLSADAEGRFRLRGGALCFPTGWALEEKLGQTMEEIHGVVPALNSTIGGSIRQFMERMRPGMGFLRDNWGIAATDELNLHPARGLAGPTLPVELERLWLRVEHQMLARLPESDGVLFGIRVRLHRLDAVKADERTARGLARALLTMSEQMAAYKRLERIRTELVRALA